MTDHLMAWILIGTAALVAIIALMYLHTHDKLDDIKGEVKSLHTRHDHEDHRMDDAHRKLNRLRHGIALLFKGEGEAFLKWWKDWNG